MDRLNLLLVGDPGLLNELVAAVDSLGHQVTLVATPAGSPFELLAGWSPAGDRSDTRHDALMVLTEGATGTPRSRDADQEATGESVMNGGHRLMAPGAEDTYDVPLRTREMEEGEQIIVEHGMVAEILEGTVAVSAVHSDGAAMLIGILPPGDFIIPHPPDSCHTELVAHTDVRIAYWTWAQATGQRRFGARLFSRILRDEAWAASQAHAYFEERLVGILRLLGEWFGKREGNRTLIDLRLTHGQLAAITCTTRPTVTRVLSMLKKSGQVGTTGHGPQRRFWIANDAGVATSHVHR